MNRRRGRVLCLRSAPSHGAHRERIVTMSSTTEHFAKVAPAWSEVGDYDAYQAAINVWAREAAHTVETDVYLVRVIQEFARWAALGQPSYSRWHQCAAFYAAVYRYAREIQTMAHRVLLSGLVALD